MLTYRDRSGTIVPREKDDIPETVAWIDVLQASSEEASFLEKALDLRIPTFDDLVEIESSSRLARDGDRLVLSLPILHRPVEGMAQTTPLGFVLTRHILLTVRFDDLGVFETMPARLAKDGCEAGGLGVFVTMMEAIVDRVADVLENAGKDLDAMSVHIFGRDTGLKGRRGPKADGNRSRAVLGKIGRTGDMTAKISESLLGAGRMIPYVEFNAETWLSGQTRARLDSLRHDIASLNDYETRLTDKVQFLLDATLGLINVDQNNAFRILTVVSIIGIPPTFIASMYGMNFKNIPEYDWSFGYQYGLALIAASAILPALWFKWRGWW